ncbi:MAG: methylglyoxal synthase [Clostridia bacterium]|nr:methylglyoxal synthase [Clostridia bacterium]
MNIALLADEEKRELLVQFCIAYSGVLSKHNLCATATTGSSVSQATGLKVAEYMPPYQGGYEQISAMISCDQIDMLVFFRSHSRQGETEGAEQNLLRLSDMHLVPCATNIATAEVLIHGLENGYLDWRDIVNPK